MKIGYACQAIAVPGSEIKSCMLKNANAERLMSLIRHNLDSLERIIGYNIENNIRLFRISSGLIPFGSSAAAELPWEHEYGEKFRAIGEKINRAATRVSMHPGQYTVLNSHLPSVAQRAAEDLLYHTKVLDSLGLGTEHKIVLHMGGTYGNKRLSASRFISRFKDLDLRIRRRLVLENDDTMFHIGDVLETACKAGIPVVYDNLHNAINPADTKRADKNWIRDCAATWQKEDGPPKIHYSQQHRGKRPGAHSDSIRIDAFLEFCEQIAGMNPDIMLEVKDKNISAVKCINCVSGRNVRALETEWARYKYSVLGKSPKAYGDIRQMLQEKKTCSAIDMYRKIESALETPAFIGNAVNAAQHVWGYFKERASDAEKKRFQKLLTTFAAGEASLKSVKNNLLHLAKKYREEYLLTGYYFYK